MYDEILKGCQVGNKKNQHLNDDLSEKKNQNKNIFTAGKNMILEFTTPFLFSYLNHNDLRFLAFKIENIKLVFDLLFHRVCETRFL